MISFPFTFFYMLSCDKIFSNFTFLRLSIISLPTIEIGHVKLYLQRIFTIAWIPHIESYSPVRSGTNAPDFKHVISPEDYVSLKSHIQSCSGPKRTLFMVPRQPTYILIPITYEPLNYKRNIIAVDKITHMMPKDIGSITNASDLVEGVGPIELVVFVVAVLSPAEEAE